MWHSPRTLGPANVPLTCRPSPPRVVVCVLCGVCCVVCRGWVRWPRSQPAWPCPWQLRLPTSCRSRQPLPPPTSPKNLPQPTSPTNPCLLRWMRRNRYVARLGSMPLDNTAGTAVAHPVLCGLQPGTRWTWGWGLLPSRRQVNSPVASPSSSFSDLPKCSFLPLPPPGAPTYDLTSPPFLPLFFVAVASFGEGESHLHDSVKMSSPIVPRVPPPSIARADCCAVCNYGSKCRLP
jgi:hypothetical protein